ncbi:hypothetical protein CBR_g36676 [Chara braunii]|uniref:Reverse transcriptase RNase H-like domain-containing protein n=1 Tax=Chara braunii TaxID=69332 RepID=A0A388LL66_CHABU|nr:hypothetical protein CBR_g36676 [Chara braunii]|eukprot:GBG83059.1 hypothetical protein CBR_g36676 [Chara braunii]
MADGGRRVVTLDDLVDALDKCERAPSNVPKVETFHFKGERVSDWLDLIEQALVGLSDEVKLQRVLRYVLHSHHREVSKVVDAANGSSARFGDLMRRKYRLGDGLLTMADLEAMNKEDFSTIGAFVHEFKKKARKVHGISEEAHCATFLGLLTGSEAAELTKHVDESEKFTWANIDKGVEDGSLDQEALRRAAAGPPAAPTMFRIWQEREDPGVRVEEIVDESEEVTQQLKAGTIKEELIVVESDDEAQEVTRESASTILERMEDLLVKVGRYQEWLRVMCEEAREGEANLPEVMLYGSGPESSSGPQGYPGVATAGSGPRSGMTFRPPTSHGRVAQAAQTRSQSKATTSQGPSQAPNQAPPRREPEPKRRKEVVEVQEEEDERDDEEDERLRQEEDQRAEQRAKKRGIRGEAEPSLHDGAPKRKKYAVRLEEGFDVERMVDKLLEGQNDLMNLKDILASAPRLRGELKGRLSRRLVPNVHLSSILPKEIEWTEAGTRMNWKCVACGLVDLKVRDQPSIAMVDTGAEMNIIRERDATMLGLEVDHSDHGVLHGANCKAIFCGTASNVMVEIERVRARTCFFVMPDVNHPILLGRSFLYRTETLVFNRHEGTMILALSDPACGNYEIIKCRNTGPGSGRNRLNLGSFTFEDSEYARRRLREEQEEEGSAEVLSLSLNDVNKAMEVVAAHDMADPEAIKALREQDFATKTEHLRKLVRQDQKWVWGEDQEKAVERMKGEFKEGGLVLGAPNYEATEEKSFVVETDAGPTALGGVLIQTDADRKERPLRFESRTLNTTERNYSQFKKETLAVLHCLRTFQNYIFGKRLVLRVDPTALACSLKSYTPSDPTIAKWLTYIWMFNFELERIPWDKNRADGLSCINWDGANQESIEDTPPIDGFLDQEEDVRLHINEWSLRVPSYVTHPIWLAPRGYEWKEELVLKPFQEEDPWGNRDVGWMMKLALAGTHSLTEEVRTIEEGSTQVEEHEQLMRGMYLLTNTLLQGNFNQRDSFGPEESELFIPESQDDEFEEGEIREAFRAEEYDGIYREVGLLLSCKMRDRDASAKAQKMRYLYVVRDDHLFIKRQVGNPKRIVCGRNRQIDVIAALHDGIAGGHRGVSATCAKISELYHWDEMLTMVIKYCQSCVPCQQRSAQRPGEPLHPRLEREVGAVVHLDLLFMPLREDGSNYIFHARDNLTSLATHLDVFRWEASRLGEGSAEPVRYVPLEEPLDLETETDTRDRGGMQDPGMAAERPDPVRPHIEEVITVGDDTPPCTPVPEPAQQSWPEGIPEPGNEEIPEFPQETTVVPEQETEMEDQGVRERARVEVLPDLPLPTHATESPVIGGPALAESLPTLSCTSERVGAEASTPEGQGPQGRGASRETREEKSARVRVRLNEIHARQAEMEATGIEPTPPVDPKMSEQRIDELWGRYESQRDAARQRSRKTGQADVEAGELREMGDLGFSATRMAIERADRKICETAVTSFHWYSLLSGELRVRELEVEHLTTQLAEERARSQAREVEWERRFGEIAAAVDRLSGAWEASQASPSRGATMEAPRQVGSMGKVPLDSAEEEGDVQESLMAMSTERRGSRLHELAAAMGIGTPQERPQRLDTPGYTSGLGGLRAELGSWATETDSGGPDSGTQQQQEVVSEPAAVAGCQPSGSCGNVAAMERPHEERPRELGTPGHEPVSTAVRGGEDAEAMEFKPRGHMGVPSCHEVTTETIGTPSTSSSRGEKEEDGQVAQHLLLLVQEGRA